MIFFLTLLVPLISFANIPLPWLAAIQIVDKHEFYEEKKVIDAPKETWQTLFAVVYINRDLVKVKDCANYRIPGTNTAGILKIKQIKFTGDCSDSFFQPGDREVGDIKALEFSTHETGMSLTLSLDEYKMEKWEIDLPRQHQSQPKMLMSSAEYKAPKVILLASSTGKMTTTPSIKLTGRCHAIDENCQELSPSRCSMCEDGWHEIPNGCPQGPKDCGQSRCGEKNQPACRRGMKYQRIEKKYDCREDTSFAYCQPGLSVQCEGNLPYCR